MIAYNSGSEIVVFSSEEAMLEYIEAIDVEEEPPEVITHDGEVLKLRLSMSGSITVDKEHPTESARKRFRKLLRKFVSGILDSGARSIVVKDEELVERIAAKFYTE